jgi:hypothetical protein
MVGAVLILSMCISPSVDAITCEDCHSYSFQSGEYIYEPPLITIICDPFYRSGEEFDIKLLIRPTPDYTITKLNCVLTIDGTSIELASSHKSFGEAKENMDMIANWTLRSIHEGDVNIIFDFEYEVYYEHDNPGHYDSSMFSVVGKTTQLHVKDLSLGISPGYIALSNLGDNQTIILKAFDNISDIKVSIPNQLANHVDILLSNNTLVKGSKAIINVTLLNETNVDSEFLITWNESSGEKSESVHIKIRKLESHVGNNFLLTIGQITGIVAFIFLIIGYFISGTGFMKKYANKAFKGSKKRIRYHCILSYFMILFAFTHIVILGYGPYQQVLFKNWEIVLGEVAIIIIILVALIGIFQKKIIKWLGFNNWRRIHSWGSYISTSLILIHLLTYGSHFLWLRELLGLK